MDSLENYLKSNNIDQIKNLQEKNQVLIEKVIEKKVKDKQDITSKEGKVKATKVGTNDTIKEVVGVKKLSTLDSFLIYNKEQVNKSCEETVIKSNIKKSFFSRENEKKSITLPSLKYSKEVKVKVIKNKQKKTKKIIEVDGVSEKEYEVEFIYGKRLFKKKIEYLIRWKNYAPSSDTWEPKKGLNCSEIIQAFEDSIELLKINMINDNDDLKRSKKNAKDLIMLPPNIVQFLQLLSNDSGPAISIVNDVDDQGPPFGFKYIDRSLYSSEIPKEEIVLDHSCDCEGDCGTNKACSCVENLNEGIPPYDKKGILQFPINSGIYECNPKCSCSKECRYKVIQRGRTLRLQIFKTINKGWGIKTLEFIQQGMFVEEYVGEIITNEEAERRGKHYDNIGLTYLFDLDFMNGLDEDCPYVIDACKYGNLSHFFNHSCDPNIGVGYAFIDNQNPNLHRLAFFALRDIEPYEELCFDYSNGADSETTPLTEISTKYPCYCGAKKCKGSVHL